MIDDEIKTAELNKLLAEAEKAKSEKLKIDYEYNKLKSEDDKPWYLKQKTKQFFLSSVLGITVIGFYLNFVALPVFNSDNIELKLKNQEEALKLADRDSTMKRDSIKYKNYIDSVSMKLNEKEKIVFNLKKYVDSVSVYQNLIQKNKIALNVNITQYKNAMQEISRLNDTIEKQSKYYQNLTDYGEATFVFTDGDGNEISVENATLNIEGVNIAIFRYRMFTGKSFTEDGLPGGLYRFSIVTPTGYTIKEPFFVEGRKNNIIKIRIKKNNN